MLRQWRRRRDSNPRYPFGVYTISNRARSTSYATSPCNCPWATGQGCNPKAGQLRPACLVYTTHCKKSRAFFPFFWLTIFCMSLRGAKRWDNPFSCGSAKQNATIPGEYVRRYEFARSSARLPSFSAGKRIAAPVCALVRNDMLKTGACQRMQVGGHEEKCVDGKRFYLVQRPCLCGHPASFSMSLRGAKRRGNPFSCGSAKQNATIPGEYVEAADLP